VHNSLEVHEYLVKAKLAEPKRRVNPLWGSTPANLRGSSKGFALTWYPALTWYSSPERTFAAPDDLRHVAGQQGSPSPACQQLSRARKVCAGGGSSEGSAKLKHGTKFGRTLATPGYPETGTFRNIRLA